MVKILEILNTTTSTTSSTMHIAHRSQTFTYTCINKSDTNIASIQPSMHMHSWCQPLLPYHPRPRPHPPDGIQNTESMFQMLCHNIWLDAPPTSVSQSLTQLAQGTAPKTKTATSSVTSREGWEIAQKLVCAGTFRNIAQLSSAYLRPDSQNQASKSRARGFTLA